MSAPAAGAATADAPTSAAAPAAGIATPEDVLAFWLGAHPIAPDAMQRVQAQWFTKDAAFDERLKARFLPTIGAALRGELRQWADTAEGRLALLIVLDQFTRNAFRGTPESFAGDAQALRLAREGIAQGDDERVPPMARVFCYLPLEHAEDAAMQRESVARFAALRDAAGAEPRAFYANTLDFARKHQDVIARFGRFPHRNAILGRADMPEERQYLAQPGAGF